MKTTTTRPATAQERARLEGYLRPRAKRNPAWAVAVMIAVPLTFALFVVLNLLLGEAVPAAVRLLAALAAGGAGAWHFGKRLTAQQEEALRPAPEVEELLLRDLESGRVAVTRYEVEAIVKVVADRPRFVGVSWFAKLRDGSVALLVQPDLEEAEFRGEFPATSFEIASGEASRYIVSLTRTGEKLAPVATRAPLSDAEWDEVGDDVDEGVPLGWPEILERAARSPLSRETLRRQAEERAAVDAELDRIVEAAEPPPDGPTRPK